MKAGGPSREGTPAGSARCGTRCRPRRSASACARRSRRRCTRAVAGRRAPRRRRRHHPVAVAVRAGVLIVQGHRDRSPQHDTVDTLAAAGEDRTPRLSGQIIIRSCGANRSMAQARGHRATAQPAVSGPFGKGRWTRRSRAGRPDAQWCYRLLARGRGLDGELSQHRLGGGAQHAGDACERLDERCAGGGERTGAGEPVGQPVQA